MRQSSSKRSLLCAALATVVLATLTIAIVSSPVSSLEADVADVAPAALTVDVPCLPAPENCAAQLTAAIRGNEARPLKVTFGTGYPNGTVFRFNSAVLVEPDVYVEGINRPMVVAGTTQFFRLAGIDNLSVKGFDVDLDNCSAASAIFFGAPGTSFNNIHISDMTIVGGDADNCDFIRSRAIGDGLHISNVNADRTRRFMWFNTGSDHRNIELDNVTVTELGYQALSFDGYVENVLIENSTFSEHAADVPGSHMIAFAPAETDTEIKSRNVTIRNNVLEGRPDTPHIKSNGATARNGGSGDLLAVRGTDGFLVEGNTIRDSGEVGITISAGARNGIVRNNVISFTDTTGLVLGNPANPRVLNVDAYGNELFQNSLDRADFHNTLPALSVWNITNSCVSNNSIHDNLEATGLWVWNGDRPPAQPSSVFDMYITANTFANNLFDFVQSERPARDFEPASSFGGTNWTSTFGTADADGDGLGAVCSSETDDTNPCEPYALADACTGNGSTTTTLPATTTTTASTTTTTTAPTTTAPTTTTTTTAPTTTAPTTTTTTTTPTTTTVPTTTTTTTTPTTTTASTTTTTTAPTTTVPTTTTTTTTPTTTTAPTTTTTTVGPIPMCDGFIATIVGSEDDDTIVGTNGRDVIVGLGGNDVIYGKNGNDVICGGDGDDELRGGRDNDIIFGEDGDDIVKGGRNNDVLSGGPGDDEMFGNTGRDIIDGDEDNDTIRGNGGLDTIDGGPGADYLAGNTGVDRLTGGDDDDTLLGGPQNDFLIGGAGSDACAGSTGRDTEVQCETVPPSSIDEFDSKIDDGNRD